MPIYLTTEMDREREYQRRVEIAKLVGELVQAAAKRNTAHCQLGLYSALERRAKVRVQRGIIVVPASEQIDYLEKVIKAHEEIIAQDAILTEKRLALVGGCRPEASDSLNRYIQTLIMLPPQPSPRPASARMR